MTDNVCPGFLDLQAGRCPIIARSDGTAKPERVSFGTSTAPGRIWSFWIHNNGASAEEGSLEVGVTTDGPIPQPPTTTPSAPPRPPPGGNPTTGLAPGPVVRYTIKVRSIDYGNFEYRDPAQNAAGQWIVHPDEFVVLDSTQKNADGLLCQVTNYPPQWRVSDPDGILRLRESTNQFLLRMDVNRRGFFTVSASVDGVDSNVLEILSAPR